MSATSSASPTVNKAATTGTYGGLVALIGAIVAGVTKSGFNATDIAGILASAGISGTSLWALVSHHSKALQHDTQVAVAQIPNIDKLRSDLDTVMPVASDVNRILSDVAPSLDRKITAFATKASQDVQALAAEVEAKAGVTPEQVKTVVHQQLAGLLSAVDASDRVPPVTATPAGNAGAATTPVYPTV